ncbi:MAG TPA: hypothetical protein VF590_05245 [Isosphaeraceae bacterium]
MPPSRPRTGRHGGTAGPTISNITFSPRGDRVATLCLGQVRVFAVPGGAGEFRPLFEPIPHRPARFNTELVPRTRVHEVATGRPAGPFLEPGGLLKDAVLSPDGRSAATISSPDAGQPAGHLLLWDFRAGRPLGPPLPMPSEPRMLAYAPDGSLLAVVCWEGEAWLVEAATGTRRSGGHSPLTAAGS